MVVNAGVANSRKAKPFVEPQRRIKMLNVNADRSASLYALMQNALENRTAQTSATMFREQCDIYDSDFVRGAIHIKPTRGSALPQDDLKARVGEVGEIMPVLRFELHPEERRLLIIAPVYSLEFVGSGAEIDLLQERKIVLRYRTHCNRLFQRMFQATSPSGFP